MFSRSALLIVYHLNEYKQTSELDKENCMVNAFNDGFLRVSLFS